MERRRNELLAAKQKLDELPGFCSVSVLVRPDDGTAVSTVTYDTWADLEAAADGAREFREDFLPGVTAPKSSK